MVITYDSEEVLILGSLEERGLPRHLAQVAPLTRQRDTLHHYPSLRGLTLLTTGSWLFGYIFWKSWACGMFVACDKLIVTLFTNLLIKGILYVLN